MIFFLVFFNPLQDGLFFGSNALPASTLAPMAMSFAASAQPGFIHQLASRRKPGGPDALDTISSEEDFVGHHKLCLAEVLRKCERELKQADLAAFEASLTVSRTVHMTKIYTLAEFS